MRKKLATLLLLLTGIAGFAAGMVLAPQSAEAKCQPRCCPDGTCITCCHEPCPILVCPP